MSGCNLNLHICFLVGGGFRSPGGEGGFRGRGGGRGTPRGRGGRGGGGFRGGRKVTVEPHRHEGESVTSVLVIITFWLLLENMCQFTFHLKITGVFICRGKEDALVTKNMVIGDSVYGEKRISVEVS